MATFLNHVAIAYPRDATATSSSNPASAGAGSVVAGTPFTPTAGRLLVLLFEGAVTATTPTGWTLPTNGSAVNNSGLYVFTRTAAGSDTISGVTHNGTNYPRLWHWIEFAAGSTFVASATAINVADNTAGPTLSGLTGTNNLFGVVGGGSATNLAASTAWTTGTELVDFSTPQVTTDGYVYSITQLVDSVLTSVSFQPTVTGTGVPPSFERLVFAVVGLSGNSDSLPAVSVAVETRGSVSKANAAGVTLVQSTEPLDGWGATTNPKVSPTVDVQTGDILVAFGIGKDSGTSIFPTTPTNSGTALTWTRKVNQSGGGTSAVAIYTATAVATETITVTLTLTTSTGPWSFRLLQWRGAIGVGASLGNAQAPAAVQPVITLAATGRKSVIISGHSDANAIDASARVWNTVNASVMAEASYYRLASSYAVMVGYSTDAGNGGSLALGLTGTGAGTHNWASGAIEILAPLTPSPPSTRSFAIPRAARW